MPPGEKRSFGSSQLHVALIVPDYYKLGSPGFDDVRTYAVRSAIRPFATIKAVKNYLP